MSGEVEAAGALATAGAVVGAIEPGDPGKPGEGACLNCGTQLAGGRYCSNCGQSARPHRTLGGLVGEFLASLWNFDTKAWRTLPMLLVRPGTLTRQYVYGKRARYISPLAAFLLSIFLMFFAFSTVQIPQNTRDASASRPPRKISPRRARSWRKRRRSCSARAPIPIRNEPAGPGGRARRRRRTHRRSAGAATRTSACAQEQARAAAQGRRSEDTSERRRSRRTRAQAAAAADGAVPAPEEAPEDRPNVGVSVNGEPVPEDSTWQEELAAAVDRGDVDVNLGHPALNARALETLRNPDLALTRIQEAASKFSFLLAPMSLPFIALLFLWKRGVTLYDHMAYALYALAFAALLVLQRRAHRQDPFVSWAAGWLLLSLPVHMYFHLGGAYALGWFSALWRTIFMLFFSLIVACIFFTMVIILGLVG